jgi:hypothetical protein
MCCGTPIKESYCYFVFKFLHVVKLRCRLQHSSSDVFIFIHPSDASSGTDKRWIRVVDSWVADHISAQIVQLSADDAIRAHR